MLNLKLSLPWQHELVCGKFQWHRYIYRPRKPPVMVPDSCLHHLYVCRVISNSAAFIVINIIIIKIMFKECQCSCLLRLLFQTYMAIMQ